MTDKGILDKLRPVTAEEQAILKGSGAIDRGIYMTCEANVVNAQKLLDSGKLISIRPHTRFVHFPEHRHDYVELVYMCAGSSRHIVNDKPILLKEGELLCLGQGARQEILPSGEEDIAVNFIILPQFFDKALEMLGEQESPLRKFIVDCLGTRAGSPGYLHFQVSDLLPIQNLVENLIWTLINDPPNKRNLNQTTMGLLFMHLLNHTDRLAYDTQEEAAIMQVFRYIEENYQRASLSQVSKLVHNDLCWLSREIKKKTGSTFTQLVQEKRLSQAAYLLDNTGLKVSDVAQAVGYTNLSYFHRIFNERFAQSPKKYRDRCK